MGRSWYDYVIVDAQNIAIRYGSQNLERQNHLGVDASIESSLVNRLLNLAREHAPARLVLAWDGLSTRLRAINPNYKSYSENAKKNKIYDRFSALRSALSRCVRTIYRSDAEADEEIGRFCASLDSLESALIVSGDRDFHQLVSERVTVLDRQKAYRSVENVTDIWGVCEPHQITLVRAMEGDVSDAIPGVQGRIKKKTLRELARNSIGVESLLLNIWSGNGLTEKERNHLWSCRSLIRQNFALMDLSAEALGNSPTFFESDCSEDKIFHLCRDLDLSELVGSKSWKLLNPWWR